MAFTAIQKLAHRGRGFEARPVVTLAKPKNQHAVQVSINVDVASAVGLAKGDYIALEVGTGEDDGWLRITKAGAGFKIGRSRANEKRVKFAVSAILRHVSVFPATVCRHAISGESLLIEIPARLRPTTLSVVA